MIQSSTINFLKDLNQNNNREWFQDNKQRYDDAQANVIAFAAELISELKKIGPKSTTGTDPKKCVMRIYRDIRFSKDKTPYKNNFGISKLMVGNKAEDMGYYVHIEPGASFAGGGYWMPQPEHLKAIRQEIDYHANALTKIIDAPHFKKLFGEFRDQEQLKNVPKGYDEGNENIGLLKLKSYAAMHKLTDRDLLKPGAARHVAGVLADIYPLTVFLNNAIT